MISFDEYKRQAMRTDGTSSWTERINNGALGLNGESGEVADIVKKFMFHGHDIDDDKLKKELGDCLWYIAQICESRGYSMEEVASMNIAKLRKRYPDGFSSEASLNRVE